MKKSHLILLGLLFFLIILIWLVPKYESADTPERIFDDYELSDIRSIEYKDEKSRFTITPVRKLSLDSLNLPLEKTLLWNVRAQQNNSDKLESGKKPDKPEKLEEPEYEFTGSSSVSSMAQNLLKLQYKGETTDDSAKHEEYGLKDCLSYIKLITDEVNQICLGKPNYNKTNRYIQVEGRDKVYISKIYLFNRYAENIFNKIDKRLFPYNAKQVKYLQITFDKKVSSKYPLLFSEGKNSLELFAVTEKEKNEEGSQKKTERNKKKNQLQWRFKGRKELSERVQRYAVILKRLLTQFSLPFVVSKVKEKPKESHVLEVSFYSKHPEDSKNREAKEAKEDKNEKIISQYKLWDTPYPSDVRFVLLDHQKKPGTRNQLSQGRSGEKYYLALSDDQSGVYSSSQLKTIYLRLQAMEDILKKDQQNKEDKAKDILKKDQQDKADKAKDILKKDQQDKAERTEERIK